MVEVPVHSERSYAIEVDINWRESLRKVLSRHEKVLVVAPEGLSRILDLQDCELLYLPEGELQKDFSTLTLIWKKLGEMQIDRKGAIIAIGGGATTDVAGFAAATWLRGIDWYAIPTTLAGMVDASIGGKTAINTEAGKNMVGAFHSPTGVYIDLSFLNTLSDRDLAAGLAEVIKTGFIADRKILEILDEVSSIEAVKEVASELVERSAKVKAHVVSSDFKEGRLREILNFGHTFGHAVEKLKSYQWRHGEAVAVGMVYEMILAENVSGISSEFRQHLCSLLAKFNLPISIPDLGWESILLLMQGDKKARSGEIRFVSIENYGKPIWLESVAAEIAEKCYERILT